MVQTMIESEDRITRDGRRAVYVKYNDSNWPAPWCMSVDGERHWYSSGGFVGNHDGEGEPLDIVGPWVEGTGSKRHITGLEVTHDAVVIRLDNGDTLDGVEQVDLLNWAQSMAGRAKPLILEIKVTLK